MLTQPHTHVSTWSLTVRFHHAVSFPRAQPSLSRPFGCGSDLTVAQVHVDGATARVVVCQAAFAPHNVSGVHTCCVSRRCCYSPLYKHEFPCAFSGARAAFPAGASWAQLLCTSLAGAFSTRVNVYERWHCRAVEQVPFSFMRNDHVFRGEGGTGTLLVVTFSSRLPPAACGATGACELVPPAVQCEASPAEGTGGRGAGPRPASGCRCPPSRCPRVCAAGGSVASTTLQRHPGSQRVPASCAVPGGSDSPHQQPPPLPASRRHVVFCLVFLCDGSFPVLCPFRGVVCNFGVEL